MTEIAYRPRSIAELVDASIQLFRSCYRQLVAITAIGYVPWIAASTFASRVADRGSEPVGLFPDTSSALVFIVGAFWFAVVSAGCMAAASDRYLGIEPDVARSLRRALRFAWPIVATSIVTWFLTILGAFLLLVPGLYFFARYAVSSTVALLEERPVGQSLNRAAALSQNRKLHILGTLGAVWAIYLVIAITVGAIGGILGMSRLAPVAEALITIGISPLIGVATAALYYDLRIRGEGFDVELMERQLRSGPESA